jgi:hypothetical protein
MVVLAAAGHAGREGNKVIVSGLNYINVLLRKQNNPRKGCALIQPP